MQANQAGSLAAVRFVNRRAGIASAITIYVDSRNRARRLLAALYSDRDGHPVSRMAVGSVSSPKAGSWNTMTIRPTRVARGKAYWITVLGTGGTLYLRDVTRRRCRGATSHQRGRLSMPAKWTPGMGRTGCLFAGFVSGSLTAPSGAPPTTGGTPTTGGPPAHTPSSGSCSGGELCVSLPAGSGKFDVSLGTQDAYGFTANEPVPGGGAPSVWQRLQNLLSGGGAWRQLANNSYIDAYTEQISPVNYAVNSGSGKQGHLAWNFRTLDKELAEAPAGTPKEVDQQIPWPLWTCPSGSWSSSGSGCVIGHNAPSGLADQSYGALASFYGDVVRYFRTGVLARGSGTTSFTPNSLTDTAQNFAGHVSDCVTATVIDVNGFPDWVTGTVASVGGPGNDTVTLSGSWSAADSYDQEAGNGALVSTTPAGGAAYNLASCTPPGGLASPQVAVPWPVPPSVGNVQYFELMNETDLGNVNLAGGVDPPSVAAPSSVMLTGVNVSGGTLSPGSTYSYEIASDGVHAGGKYCVDSATNNTCGGFSTPSSVHSIVLPPGDNAVQVSWSAPAANAGQLPQAYEVYGRSSGGEQGLAVVGRDASGGLTWTDNGTVTPSGSPNSVDESPGGNEITPGIYSQIWNAVTPAMRAVDSSIKLAGPVEANSTGYGPPSVDTSCVTTSGVNSPCTNGDPGYSIGSDYIPTLLFYGNPKPDVITFHAYGSSAGNSPESPVFGSISGYEVAGFNRVDKAAIDAANVPVWIDESNINASTVGSWTSGTDYRSMTQMGSAWLADDVIQWANADSHIQHILQWAANAGDASFELFGGGTPPSNCLPQPACLNLRKSQPDLQYWSIYEINHLLGSGTIVPISGVPAGFAAIAVQTDAHTVDVMLVNLQAGNNDGNGAPGAVDIQVQGAAVTNTSQTTINGNTNMATGPSTKDLGAQSNVSINAAGYQVDILKFTI